MNAAEFQARILAWFNQHGRKNLPWQQQKSPYRVWISEIMLQQTQVASVIPYFTEFTQRFPDVSSLAQAPLDEVLHLWSGLGYYARARNIHKSAMIIAQQNQFPNSLEELMALPGIGRSTAAAIMSIAFNQSHAILDGNVKRVLSRFLGISGWPGLSQVNKQLWAASETFTPASRVADYTQAMMDLGATLCRRSQPLCSQCPLNSACIAYRQKIAEQLPTPKAKTKLPVKHKTLLLLQNAEQQVLLYKRPPVGIWGGLWSLPEFDNNKRALSWCQQHYHDIKKSITLPTRRHTFSHFHLDYQTLVVTIERTNNTIMEAEQMLWYHALQLNLGLPAPIKKLIKQLENHQLTPGEHQ